MQALQDQKGRALLSGLLRSRARDWLLKYPHRFLSRDTKELSGFIKASAEADDAERARIQRIVRRIFRGAIAAAAVLAIVAIVAISAGIFAWRQQRIAEEQRAEAEHRQVNLLAEVASSQRLRGNLNSALRLSVHAVGLDLRLDQSAISVSVAPFALAAAIWQTKWRLSLSGHEDSVKYAAFSPDGSRIVTASADKTARTWDAATAKEIAVLSGHENTVPESPPVPRLLVSWNRSSIRFCRRSRRQ